MKKDYVFYNKKLWKLFNDLCTWELEALREACKDIDKDLMPYQIKPIYWKDKYHVTKAWEPLDAYWYFAKTIDEIQVYTLQEAIDFIDRLKQNE